MLIHTKTWNHKNVLCERSLSQQFRYCTVLFTWNVQNGGRGHRKQNINCRLSGGVPSELMLPQCKDLGSIPLSPPGGGKLHEQLKQCCSFLSAFLPMPSQLLSVLSNKVEKKKVSAGSSEFIVQAPNPSNNTGGEKKKKGVGVGEKVNQWFLGSKGRKVG